VVCSKTSVLHHFRGITTFTVYVTAVTLRIASVLIRWNYKPLL